MPSVTTQVPVMAKRLLDYFFNMFGAGPTTAVIPDCEIRLFTSADIPITPISSGTTFIEATFGGYTNVLLKPGTVITVDDGGGEGYAKNALFVADGSGPPENIQGYYLVETGTTNFIMGEYFPAPIPLTTAGDYIDLLVRIPILYSPDISV